MDKDKINKMAEEFANKFECSNYEHHNPTIEDVKAFILDIILEVKNG